MRVPVLCAVVLALGLACSAHAQTQTPTTPAPNAVAPTGLFVKFRVKAGKNAAFEAAFRQMQKSMREKEPGNLYYDLFVTPEDPQLYVILERYKDAAAVAEHNQTDHIKKILAELRELMDAPIDPQRLIFVSSK